MKTLVLIFALSNTFNYQILLDKYSWLTAERHYIIRKECKFYDLDMALVCSLIHEESRGKKYAKSHKNARGLMQVRYFHFPKGMPVRWHYNEGINILHGCKYLSWCKDRSSSIDEMLKHYNSGYSSKFYNWKYINNIKRRFNDGGNRKVNLVYVR